MSLRCIAKLDSYTGANQGCIPDTLRDGPMWYCLGMRLALARGTVRRVFPIGRRSMMRGRISRQLLRGRRRSLTTAGVAAVIVLAPLAWSHPSRAATLIASDTFNRTVSNGWGTADQGGSWTVLDTSSNWSVSPG